MKNIKIKILTLSLLTSMTAIAAVSGTISWFTGQTSIGPGGNILGSTQGAYFAGGDGLTAETAYQITNKYHVYNLAWLQYIEDDVHYFGGQRYFKVMNDIDMEGLAIPPIGTIENPFIGNFNGNSKVIHNFTIANVVANDGIKEKPGIVQNLNEANIVGFFGVVGKLPDTDLGEGITYSSSVNKVYNLSLENFKVKVGQTTGGNLIGLAAGYVNAKMESVAVGSSKFDIAQGVQPLTSTRLEVIDETDKYVTNLSNYGTVGYCTTNYLKKSNIVDVSAKNPSVENGSVSGGGNNFGASIPMEDIYNHLLGVKGAGSDQLHSYTYPGSITEHYDSDGNLDSSRTEEGSPQTPELVNNTYHHSGTSIEDESGNTIAAYSFANREDTDDYMYLSGSQEVKGYYINGNVGSSSGTIRVAARNNTKWILRNNQYCLYNESTSTYQTLGLNYSYQTGYTVVLAQSPNYTLTYNASTKLLSGNSRYVVISNNNGALSLSTTTSSNSATKFERETVIDGGNTYYSFYSPFTSTVTKYQDVKYSGIVIYNGDANNPHYLKATSNTTFTDSTTIDKYCFWTINANGYLKNDQYNCYLFSNNGTLAATNTSSNNDNYIWVYDSTGNCLSVGGSQSGARDLTYDNGWKLIKPATEYKPATEGGTIYHFYCNYNTRKYYLENSSGTTIVASNTDTPTTNWQLDNNGRIYTAKDDGNYYLTYNSSTTIAIAKTATWYYYYDSTNHRLYNSNSPTGTKYYLSYNGSFSENGTTTYFYDEQDTIEPTEEVKVVHNQNVTYRVDKDCISVDDTSTQETRNVSYHTGSTYFPLQFNDDDTDIGDTNTGYIVSGANSSSWPEGDMRVSRYDYFVNLSNSYGSIYENDAYMPSQKIYYKSGNTTYYLNASASSGANTGSLSRGNNANSATTWYILGNNAFCILNGDKYYLEGCEISDGTVYLGLSLAKADTSYDAGRAIFNNNGTIYLFTYQSQQYYLNYSSNYYSGGSFTYSTTSLTYNDGSFAFGQDITYTDAAAAEFEILTRTSNSNGYVRIEDTYNQESTGDYVSSAISSLNKMTVQQLGLKKYNTARGYFHTSLKNSGTDIYGLHFMDAQISMNRLVNIDRAMANGWEYLPDGTVKHHVVKTDSKGNPVKKVDEHGDPVKDKYGNYVYEYIIDEDDTIYGSHKYTLPEDCIDFNLSDNGTINFFAGSYFPGNTAFFSLHHIKRFDNDPAQIQWIKEIRQVYLNSAYESEYNPVTNPDVPKYVYKYSDGTYSSGTVGDLLFDMAWVTDIGNNMINYMTYYFEIPAIGGEYALGSVSGADGAYLMYLDIGASGKSAEITVVKENVKTVTDTYALPDGVDYANLTDGENNPINVSVVGGEVGTVIIPSGTYGSNITFSYDASDKILTCGPPESGGTQITKSTYHADGVSIECNGEELDYESETTVKIEKAIETTYTYDVDNDRLYTDVFTVTTTTIDDGTPSTDSGVNDPQVITYEVTEEVYNSKYKLELIDSTGNWYFEIYYQASADAEINLKYLYTYDSDTGKYNYVLIVDTNVELQIHVLSVEEGFNFTIRTVVNTSGDTSDQSATVGNTYTVNPKETE